MVGVSRPTFDGSIQVRRIGFRFGNHVATQRGSTGTLDRPPLRSRCRGYSEEHNVYSSGIQVTSARMQVAPCHSSLALNSCEVQSFEACLFLKRNILNYRILGPMCPLGCSEASASAFAAARGCIFGFSVSKHTWDISLQELCFMLRYSRSSPSTTTIEQKGGVR